MMLIHYDHSVLRVRIASELSKRMPSSSHNKEQIPLQKQGGIYNKRKIVEVQFCGSGFEGCTNVVQIPKLINQKLKDTLN